MTSLEGGRWNDGVDIDAPTADTGPLGTLLSGERSELVRDALTQLNDREREVIVMTYVEERSLSAIGAALGVTESRVCQIRARALRSLRRILASNGLTEVREEIIA
jgi:RNA polymerase sigma factor (sigma-70 family)